MQTAAWQGPPHDILGHPVPIEQFVVRTDDTVVALQHALAFREGCCFTLQVAVRRGSADETTWKSLTDRHSTRGFPPEPTDADLKFGVRFPDGSKATTVGNSFHGWANPAERPDSPRLVDAGGGFSSDDRYYQGDQRLWLWPLPPPAPFEFVIEWRKRGIGATPAVLDGSAVMHAAEQARPYWPQS
ncbi:hypothetical protein [Amycolatopsis sp. BJA-103]|uniref:hypothetical protein n=1 Tax=unclassified Amycolatopsis TaxID=2618356 RepID=UPI000C790E55|nr:hypothetical protein [Amycolatopsis sp. BJA-103]AUI64023.1 hypothetical protein BKN51_41665 [Amycolatopsis sp. BJA-103]PNE16054.1 hypothetical protein B1H26_27550 [Amycolatopsis sp. BJA-103]